MQLPLLIIWILHLMEFSKGQDHTKTLRYKRGSSSVSRLCHPSCVTCSTLNGCLSCKPRLFFHLEWDGARQRGACLSSCPRGHYGIRSPHISTCTRCREDCTSCFNKNFCTRCHPGHFLFRGRCEDSCPEGTAPNTGLRECTECQSGCQLCVDRDTCVRCRPQLFLLHGQCHHSCPQGWEADVQLMQCIPPVHCVVGEWGYWGPCLRKGGSSSHHVYRRGEETRTRAVIQPSRPPGTHRGPPCPHTLEWRRCVIRKRLS